MSTTTLWAVYKSKVTAVAEYQNSHGSGPAIWDLMAKRYLHIPMPWGGENLKRLWALATDRTVAEHLRITHAATFDYAMIPVAKLGTAAEAFEKAHDDIIRLTDWTWNHWSAIAADLRKMSTAHDRRLVGAGIGCTSIGDPWEEFKHRDREPWDCVAHAIDVDAAA